MLNQQYSISF